MKKRIIAYLITVVLLLSACSGNKDDGRVLSPTQNTSDSAVIPCSGVELIGLNVSEVMTKLEEAGFENIEQSPLEDITSTSEINDGSVESVSINGSTTFTAGAEFNRDATVIVMYHSIPKLKVPLSSDDAKGMHFLAVAEKFYEAGFETIITDEQFDLIPETSSVAIQTNLTANNGIVFSGSEIPFDSKISITSHFPIPSHPISINVNFEGNLIFSKYAVVAKVDDVELGKMEHATDSVFSLSLTEGSHTVTFVNAEKEKVEGTATLEVDSETSVVYKIKCHSDKIDVEQTNFAHGLVDGMLKLRHSSDYYLMKDYRTVTTDIKNLGFSQVTAKKSSGTYWSSAPVGSVIGIMIANKDSFSCGDIFSNNAAVEILYHVPDFKFLETSIEITEQENFEIAYEMTSGDSIETISFEFDKDILKKDDDHRFTAISPGKTTVTAKAGDYECSKCEVTVKQIIVPISSITIAEPEMDVVVGSSFEVKYTIEPTNANYTDIEFALSNNYVIQNEDGTLYSNNPGDTKIVLSQDGKELGECLVHASVIDIENLVWPERVDPVLVAKELKVPFSVEPVEATPKGITITSKNPKIAEVSFDERGATVAVITGISAGSTTIVATTPAGSQYLLPIVVEEILPTEIDISTEMTRGSFQVGSQMPLTASFQPLDTSIKDVTWKSSNEKVLIVSADGLVEAVGVGTAEIIATHKSGVSTATSITVQPTPVTAVTISTPQDKSASFTKGKTLALSANILPENATDKSVKWISMDETIATVSDKGVVTAKGMGTVDIIAESPDGPKAKVSITVDPSPQKFKVTWSAKLVSNDHVGSSWSKQMEVNGEKCSSGAVVTVDYGTVISLSLSITERDSRPDVGTYSERIEVTNDLCNNGFSKSGEIVVRENGGRYSGNCAYWSYSVTLKPVN